MHARRSQTAVAQDLAQGRRGDWRDAGELDLAIADVRKRTQRSGQVLRHGIAHRVELNTDWLAQRPQLRVGGPSRVQAHGRHCQGSAFEKSAT
jgi:hypothetical protein